MTQFIQDAIWLWQTYAVGQSWFSAFRLIYIVCGCYNVAQILVGNKENRAAGAVALAGQVLLLVVITAGGVYMMRNPCGGG